MECKDCKKDISDDNYRKVADWVFCLECFNKLMAESEQRSEERTEQKNEPVLPEKKRHNEGLKCSVCGIGIEKDLGKKFGIWHFCEKCLGDLVFKAPQSKPAQVVEKDDVAEPVGRVQVRTNIKVKCHGCGRQIFDAGANNYKGKSLCPECFYSLPEEERKPREPDVITLDSAEESEFDLNQSVQNDEGNAGIGESCESCERLIYKDNFKVVDGFRICNACLATDKELVVKLARDRHRKRLNRLRSKIAGD